MSFLYIILCVSYVLITEQTSDVPSSIKVSWLPQDVTEHFITDFFENSRRSGGGDVENVCYDEKTNTAIITFQDPDGYFEYFDSVMIQSLTTLLIKFINLIIVRYTFSTYIAYCIS